jgi:glycosyltransferase involved in cell wall biosynthesis
MLRLAVITSHPIQYNAPLFRRLTERGRIIPHVLYNWEGASMQEVLDPGFGQRVRWDIPLLEGYSYEFVPNRSKDPGPHQYKGLDNPELVSRVLRRNPDAVLVFGWASKSHLHALRKLHGRFPVFFRGDSTLLGERRGLRRWARRVFLRWVYRHIDVALYVGQHNRSYFKAHGLREDQLVWVPHSVDNERFSDAKGDYVKRAQALRRKLGIPDEDIIILFVGKLEAQKAPEVLLEAFMGLKARNAHLVFAGSGHMEGHLHRMAQENQSVMPVVYHAANVFVLASRGETWGLAVNEAMACACPVVVSDRVGCAPDLVREGQNGHVVPSGDADALRAVLGRLALQPSACHQMGMASRQIIDEWSIERAAMEIELAVQSVVQDLHRV